MQNILLHYGEIALKGRNRPLFVRQLADNIRFVTGDEPVAHLHKLSGRLLLTAQPDSSFSPAILSKLKCVFGLTSFAPALAVPLNIDAMQQAAMTLLAPKQYESFRVSARRAF